MSLRLEKTEGVYGPTLQGEGINIGMMVSFVRFYGCDFRCTWCDTPFSLGKDKGGEYEIVQPEQIVERLNRIGVRNVVLSGGNPLVQPKPAFNKLLQLLTHSRYWIQIETQGSVLPSETACALVRFWSLSPKLPSAGKMASENWKAVHFFTSSLFFNPEAEFQFKFVVANREDYDTLKSQLLKYPEIGLSPIILQPEGQQLTDEFSYHQYAYDLQNLHKLVVDDWLFWKSYTVRVLPQYHKLIWQKERKV